MTKAEMRILINLEKRLYREAAKLQHKANRMYKNAGHSDTPEGTGDEGWRETFIISGHSDGLLSAARQLRQIRLKFKTI